MEAVGMTTLTAADVRRKARLALISRAAGVDTNPTPESERLHAYWVLSPEGLSKWADSPHPWQALYDHLVKFMPPQKAKRVTSAWHFEVFHQHTGSDAYRVEHGGKMRGKRIGPG